MVCLTDILQQPSGPVQTSTAAPVGRAERARRPLLTGTAVAGGNRAANPENSRDPPFSARLLRCRWNLSRTGKPQGGDRRIPLQAENPGDVFNAASAAGTVPVGFAPTGDAGGDRSSQPEPPSLAHRRDLVCAARATG